MAEDKDARMREEIVGHVSTGAMGLLGLAVYSGTYSMLMASGASPRVVPVLEMWMLFTHLVCCGGCILMPVLAVGVFGKANGIPSKPPQP